MASDPFVGEIMLFAGNFAPAGWLTCDGQLLDIATYDTLYQLIGTTFGGDGSSTFALPDLRGRIPLHLGSGGGSSYALGQTGGVESVTLVQSQIPSHTHTVVGDGNSGTQSDPTNAYYAATTPDKLYSSSGAPLLRVMNPAMLPSQGGSQPHSNLQPFLAVTFCISLFGTFPSAT